MLSLDELREPVGADEIDTVVVAVHDHRERSVGSQR